MGEFRYFLRLGDIAGPSIVEHHAGELELTELSWGLHSAATPAFGGGGGVGKVQVDALTARAPTSIASPVLMQACAKGATTRTRSSRSSVAPTGRWTYS